MAFLVDISPINTVLELQRIIFPIFSSQPLFILSNNPKS
jgi:hypothetical protein